MENFIAAEMIEVQNPMKALNSLLSPSLGGEAVTDEVIATDTTRYWNPLDMNLRADEQQKKGDGLKTKNDSRRGKEKEPTACIVCAVSTQIESDKNDLTPFRCLVDSSYQRSQKEKDIENENSKTRECFESIETLTSVPFHDMVRNTRSARASVSKSGRQESQDDTVTSSQRAVSAKVFDSGKGKNSPNKTSQTGIPRSRQTPRRAAAHRQYKAEEKEGRKKTSLETKRSLVAVKSAEETKCKPTSSWKVFLSSPFTKRQRSDVDSSNKSQSK